MASGGGVVPLGASPRLCFSGAFHGLKAVVIHYWRTSGTPRRRELAAHSNTLALEPTGGVEHDWRTSGTPGRRELAAHFDTLVLGRDGWGLGAFRGGAGDGVRDLGIENLIVDEGLWVWDFVCKLQGMKLCLDF